MKYIFNGQDPIAALSRLPGTDMLTEASAEDLRVLVCLLSMGTEATVAQLCAACGASQARVKAALTYWQGCQVLTDTETAPKRQPLRSARELDAIDSDTAAVYIEENNMQGLIDACQQISGRVYNTGEIATVVGLSQQLGLENTYILTLLEWCRRMGKNTLRYVEKTAFGLYEDGIETTAELDAHIKRRESVSGAEGRLRKLFGIGERALSRKERETFGTWICDYGYSMDVIGLAYDITVDTKNKSSVSYTDGILKHWHQAGVRTVSEAQALSERERADKFPRRERQRTMPDEPRGTEGSFSTDDFFTAALNRSYGDKK